MPRLLACGLFLVLVLAAGEVATGLQVDAPQFDVGDRWEYRAEARLSTLLGLEETEATVDIQGTVVATVSSVGEFTLIEWDGNLALEGGVTLDLDRETVAASVGGHVRLDREEHHTLGAAIPRHMTSTVAFDLRVEVSGFGLDYGATLRHTVDHMPEEDLPRYPLVVGEREATFRTQWEISLAIAFFGLRVNESAEDARMTRARLTVGSLEEVHVPAGKRDTVPVTLDALGGPVLSPLQELLPGTLAVAYMAPDLALPVLLRYLDGDEEVGRLALTAFVPGGSGLPPWALAALVGLALAVPVAFLVLRARRERRRGL